MGHNLGRKSYFRRVQKHVSWWSQTSSTSLKRNLYSSDRNCRDLINKREDLICETDNHWRESCGWCPRVRKTNWSLGFDMLQWSQTWGRKLRKPGRDILLGSECQECRIYRLQGHFAETREKEKINKDNSAIVLKCFLSGKKITKRVKMWTN